MRAVNAKAREEQPPIPACLWARGVTELEHEQQNESNVLSVMKRLSSSSLRQPNVLFLNIWLKQALQSLAANELQRSIMYDQTGSPINLNNELSSLE